MQSDDELGNLTPFFKDILLKSLVTTAWNRLEKAGKKWLEKRDLTHKEFLAAIENILKCKETVTPAELEKLARVFSSKSVAYIRTLEMKIQKGDDERLEEAKAKTDEFLKMCKGEQVSGESPPPVRLSRNADGGTLFYCRPEIMER